MHKKITIQQSAGELIVVVDYGSQFKGKQKLVGGDWDGVRVALLREGCAERQIVEALGTLETQKTATIIASHGPRKLGCVGLFSGPPAYRPQRMDE